MMLILVCFLCFLFGDLWQVFIQVDEKGTEAVMVDDTSGNLLFLGAVKDPSKAAI